MGHTTRATAFSLRLVSDERIKTHREQLSTHLADERKTDHPCHKTKKEKKRSEDKYESSRFASS